MSGFNFADPVRKLLKDDKGDCVAVDLGAAYTKGLYLSGGKIKSFMLERNRGQAVKAVCEWLRQENLMSHEVRIAVKGPETLIRYVTFPKMPKGNLKEVFGYEIAKFIPFPKDEVYFDLSVLEEEYSPSEMFLLIAVAKKDFIDRLTENFMQAKVNVDSITVSSVPLINLFWRTGVPAAAAEDNCALLDIGYDSSVVNLFRKDIPCLSREIKVASANFIQKISTVKGLSPEEAHDFVASLNVPREGLNQEEVQETLEIIEETAYELAEEIKNSLDYFEVNFGQRVRRLYVIGGLSKVKGLDKVMAHSLDLEINIWDPFAGLDIIADNDAGEFRQMLAVSLGMLL
jgi:type IV pilus assembly protein PilM